jgi:hypothetical protein
MVSTIPAIEIVAYLDREFQSQRLEHQTRTLNDHKTCHRIENKGKKSTSTFLCTPIQRISMRPRRNWQTENAPIRTDEIDAPREITRLSLERVRGFDGSHISVIYFVDPGRLPYGSYMGRDVMMARPEEDVLAKKFPGSKARQTLPAWRTIASKYELKNSFHTTNTSSTDMHAFKVCL